jgi:hypothetical protein
MARVRTGFRIVKEKKGRKASILCDMTGAGWWCTTTIAVRWKEQPVAVMPLQLAPSSQLNNLLLLIAVCRRQKRDARSSGSSGTNSYFTA